MQTTAAGLNRQLYNKRVAAVLEKPTKTQKIVRYFADTHLGGGHKALSEIAKESGIDTAKLSAGEYLIFTNTAMSALKLYAPGNIVAYLKPPGGRLDPDLIASIPRFFNGTEIQYDKALKEKLTRDLSRRTA